MKLAPIPNANSKSAIIKMYLLFMFQDKPNPRMIPNRVPKQNKQICLMLSAQIISCVTKLNATAWKYPQNVIVNTKPTSIGCSKPFQLLLLILLFVSDCINYCCYSDRLSSPLKVPAESILKSFDISSICGIFFFSFDVVSGELTF